MFCDKTVCKVLKSVTSKKYFYVNEDGRKLFTFSIFVIYISNTRPSWDNVKRNPIFMKQSDPFKGHHFHRRQSGLRYTVASYSPFSGLVPTPGKQDFILPTSCFSNFQFKKKYIYTRKNMCGWDG